MLPNFSYIRAKSVEDAVERLSSPGSVVLAGGTDLLGSLRDGVFVANLVVSISRVTKLRGVEELPNGGLRIGALASVAEVSENPHVIKRFPGLAQAASEVASPQLRNQGTMGGNLCQKPRCWYYRGEFHCRRKGGSTCYAFGAENQFHAIFGHDFICAMVHPSDTAPMLTALDSTAKVYGPRGTRLIPFGSFFVPPSENVEKETVLEAGEIVTEILIPKPGEGLRTRYRKVRARRSWDFALVGVALALNFSGDNVQRARVVFSGVAPIPWRSEEAEQVITGQKLDAQTITNAANAAVADAQPLELNQYKIPLVQGVLKDELMAIAKQ
jgi:xanthine dehydrogenase YagS FAD-binding subunit